MPGRCSNPARASEYRWQNFQRAEVFAYQNGATCISRLLGCAREFLESRKSDRFGNEVDVLQATLKNWRAAQSSASARLSADFEAELKQLSVDVYQGEAEIVMDQSLQIVRASGARIAIRANNIIVATGSRPDFIDTSNPRLVNSDSLLGMTTCPGRLAIIGGGHIGCEFASICRALGSEVILIERQNRVLFGWEPQAAERVTERLQTRGVVLRLNCDISADQIVMDEDAVHIAVSDEESIDVDLALLATGRRPNSSGLGLQGLGIDDTSFLSVDTHMRLP